LLAAPSAAGANGDEQDYEVIATGLNNPRGLDVRGRGTVFVAEAGTGGDSDICIPNPEGVDQCLGYTGAITRIQGTTQTRVVDGLPSFAVAGGGSAVGPSDVDLFRNEIYAVMGLGGAPADRDALGPEAELFGKLLRLNKFGGRHKVISDIAGFEGTDNPDGTEVDTNPISFDFRRGSFYVADAGGNSLLRVDSRGRASTAAVLPPQLADAPPFLGLPPGSQIPAESVPTSVETGPDGALYVGQLTGFPFPIGGASVVRVLPGQAPTVYAAGFTNIMDIAFAPNGDLYVLEIATNSLLGEPGGALWRVPSDGHPELILAEPLFFPGGVAVSRITGDVYVTNCSVCPGGGEVLRIDAP
jgi:DNA-binding beta-propeller fold protein YncE